jgi:hypothetical protein
MVIIGTLGGVALATIGYLVSVVSIPLAADKKPRRPNCHAGVSRFIGPQQRGHALVCFQYSDAHRTIIRNRLYRAHLHFPVARSCNVALLSRGHRAGAFKG